MEKYVSSSDGISIHYKVTSKHKTALAFIHGWFKNSDWWANQLPYFKNEYCVAQIDLGGYGKSGKLRI